MHFAIGVMTKLGPNEAGYMEELNERLAPFSEHLEVDPYISLTKADIIKHAKEIKEEIESGKREKNKWNENYLKCKTDEDFWNAYTDNGTDTTYDENGNELTTWNPNSRWDWYEIGGRWPGFFEKNEKKETADCIKIENWNFEMSAEEEKEARRWYEIVCEDSPMKEGEDKERYQSIKNWNNPEWYKKRYPTLETYLNEPSHLPYEVLDVNGNWWERPELSYDDPKRPTAELEFYCSMPKRLAEFKDYYCTIVDIHD